MSSKELKNLSFHPTNVLTFCSRIIYVYNPKYSLVGTLGPGLYIQGT